MLARLIAAICAPLIAAATVSQGWLSTLDMMNEGATAGAGVWRYLGYFTVLTNALVVLVLAHAALNPDRPSLLASPRVELMTMTSILFVGAVYNLLLASQWDPQGLRKINDVILHDISPLAFAAFWLLRPRGGVGWRDALFAASWPFAYSVYGLARGAFDGFYPYYFMNPATTPLPQLAINMAALIAAFVAGALVLVALDRAGLRRRSAA